MSAACPHEPPRIALTGGIASGKSTVAALFRELGAVIIDADLIARRVVQAKTPCWQKLREYLGPDYFDEDGQLKRRKLRERVVREPSCRRQVNSIVHPFVLEAMQEEWSALKENHPQTIILFDIPLLFEIGMAERFQAVVLVYAPRERQIERLMARDGITRAEAEQSLAMQLPIESKRAKSQYIIDNSGDSENTRKQVKAVWQQLIRLKDQCCRA